MITHSQGYVVLVKLKMRIVLDAKFFYYNSIHIKNKIIVLTRAGLTLNCDPGQQHSSAPVQDSIRDAECLPACSWKAAGPLWRASSQSCFVTGPHSSGPPGSMKAGKVLTISTGKPSLIPSALILTAWVFTFLTAHWTASPSTRVVTRWAVPKDEEMSSLALLLVSGIAEMSSYFPYVL